MTIAPEELFARMEKAITAVAEYYGDSRFLPGPLLECIAIKALLPEPIDPDWEIAGDIAESIGGLRNEYADRGDVSVHSQIFRGMKAGRELERSGK